MVMDPSGERPVNGSVTAFAPIPECNLRTALTPALRAAVISPGEREDRAPLSGESNGLGRAGVSVLNRGAHGAGVVEFIGSSQAHWFFERCFPLTPALGERENRPLPFRQSGAPRLAAARDAVFPLPAGGPG